MNQDKHTDYTPRYKAVTIEACRDGWTLKHSYHPRQTFTEWNTLVQHLANVFNAKEHKQ